VVLSHDGWRRSRDGGGGVKRELKKKKKEIEDGFNLIATNTFTQSKK
jgi:hypothetical protein